jgi:hypothetical protein
LQAIVKRLPEMSGAASSLTSFRQSDTSVLSRHEQPRLVVQLKLAAIGASVFALQLHNLVAKLSADAERRDRHAL